MYKLIGCTNYQKFYGMLQLGDIVGREIFMLNNLHKICGVIILHFRSLRELFLQLTVTIWTSTWSGSSV